MKDTEFDRLRSEVEQLLTCIDVAEEEGLLKRAANLRIVARAAASISASAKTFEKREREMNWRPAGAAQKPSQNNLSRQDRARNLRPLG